MTRFALIVFFIIGLLTTTALAQDTPPQAPDPEAAAGRLVEITEEAGPAIAQALENFLNQLQQVPLDNQIVQIAFVIGGVLLLFFGWRIYSLVILASGALIGASLAVGIFGSEGGGLLIGALIVGALLGALLAAVLYYVAVALMGAYVGVVFTAYVAAFLEVTLPIWGLVIAAILGAILLLGLSFELLVLLSSIIGAQLLMLALGLSPLAGLLLIILGVILQTWLTRRFGYEVRRRPARRGLLRARD